MARLRDARIPRLLQLHRPNAAAPPRPSTVSFDVRWRGKAAPVRLRDTTDHFSGQFIDSTATIAWSARQPPKRFAFVSASASTSATISAVIGREPNGQFLNAAGDKDERD